MPGVIPDTRGVVLGQRGLILLPTIEHLVSFFRVYGSQDSLDELLPTLKIQEVKTQLKTREFIVTFDVSSSYQMDRCAGISKMLGGLSFTGTSRHFVKYRDPSSPLGYDVDRLLPSGGDMALYHDDFSQPYQSEREVPFRQLIMRLTPRRIAEGDIDQSSDLLLSVSQGLSGAVQGYLYRNGVDAEAAVVEWPAESAFDEGPRRMFLFRCRSVAPRIVALMDETPGVEVYLPLANSVAVERGYRHPVHLPSCLSVFGEDSLYLFSGSRDTVDVVDPLPSFAHVRQLSRVTVDLGKALREPAKTEPSPEGLLVPLSLVPTSEPWRRVVGVSIPWERVDWLKRLVYTLPPKLLSETRVHVSKERIVILGEPGVESLPIGTPLCNRGEMLLVAAGYSFQPQVSAELLQELLSAKPGELYVFEPGMSRPYVVVESEMLPLGKQAVSAFSGHRTEALDVPMPESAERSVRYDDLGVFPLWGLPGRRGGDDT